MPQIINRIMNMKRFFATLLVCMCAAVSMLAQGAADKIIGNYQIDYNGKQSKVKIFKYGDGYRVQNTWARESKNEDGSVKLDVKNPDKAKRKVPVSEIVLIDKVTYDGEMWCDGKIYDPTSGKKYNVEIRIKDAKTLEVRGKLGPFFKRIYWTKIQ